MTRFARAKGSKASNERVPDEATPWHVMKEQLETTLSKEDSQPQTKTKSARELINEKDDLYYAKSLGNIKTDWAEFENTKKSKNKEVTGEKEGKKILPNQKKTKKNNDKVIVEDTPSDSKINTNVINTENKNNNVQKKDLQNKTNASDNLGTDNAKSKKRKLKKKNSEEIGNEVESKKPKTEIETISKNGVNNKLSKRQKRNMKKQNIKSDVSSTFNVTGNDWNNEVKGDEINKKENFDHEKRFQCNDNQNNNLSRPFGQNFKRNKLDRFGGSIPRKYQKKTAKIRDDKEHKRRKPEVQVMKVNINGMDVEIVKYDGFPVKKEDAERLAKLRKEMVLKGIPKVDIDAAMKLERRKCEKALARIRKQVCFHCRKAGHNLSECPELGKEEVATGICFKCGSTEHTHFECKVHKSDDYKFAKCFICREQGHIAKQCPDNPKGLYPDGGGCKICGDVTHLKKDCPDFVKEQEDTTITLNTIKDDNLESLDHEPSKEKKEKKPSKKVVKF